MAFNRRPKSKAEFLAEAEALPITAGLGSTGFETGGIERVLTVAAKPWEGLDPTERARNVFNLRLNDHDLAILRHLAEQNEDLSMQKVAKRILVPELRRRVNLNG